MTATTAALFASVTSRGCDHADEREPRSGLAVNNSVGQPWKRKNVQLRFVGGWMRFARGVRSRSRSGKHILADDYT